MVKVNRCLILLFLFFANNGFAQYAPISTIGNVSTYSPNATVQISVTNFSNIANCDLTIIYDPAIALATSVTTGSSLVGVMSYGVAVPGEILISWSTFPGIALPNNTVIFNLIFAKVASGITPISWSDDGFSCRWGDGNYNDLIDVPTATYYIHGSLTFFNNNAPHSILPVFSSCNGSFVEVPLKVSEFTDIGKLNLSIQFDQTVSAYISWTNISGFPGLTVNSPSSGIVNVSGIVPNGNPGFSLADSAILLKLQFYLQGGISNLTFLDNGISCQYTGPPPTYHVLNDIPFGSFYFNGSLTGVDLPGQAGIISGPLDGNVCQNQSGVLFSVEPILNAAVYNWTFPPGFTISSGAGSNLITVYIDPTAISGNATVNGVNGCGSGLPSPEFPVVINLPPGVVTQPSSPGSVIEGKGTAIFVVNAEGSDLVFQWQEFTTGWNDISDGGVYNGTNSATFTISQPPLSMNGYRYRCRINGFCPPETFTDGLATLTVSPVIGVEEYGFESFGLTIYPNPISNNTQISFCVPKGSFFKLTLNNMLGEELFSDTKEKFSEGLYLCHFPDDIPVHGVAIVYLTIEFDGKIFSGQKKIILP